ncbi:MAG: aspartate kinase [Sulfolobaceae archaeon]|nr:aspartate kinase [Sulfolobaceae archaeon]
MNNPQVIKIGGSLLRSSKSYVESAQNIKKFIEEKETTPIVVVSAMKGATDLLIKVAENNDKHALKTFIENYLNVASELDNYSLLERVKYLLDKLVKVSEGNVNDLKRFDLILSFGEKISKLILTSALENEGIKACSLDADELIITNDKHGDAEIDLGMSKSNVVVMKELISEGILPVIEGFIGRSYSGEITTLGRGGSDYTASSISHMLNASHLYLITDTPGIYSSDPNLISNVKLVKELDYQEALEASLFSIKRINPKTFLPLLNSNTEVHIGLWNNFNTTVRNSTSVSKDQKVKVIGYKNEGGGEDNIKIGIVGREAPKDSEVIKRVIETLASDGIDYNEIYINKNRPSISIAVSKDIFVKALSSLHNSLIEVR